MLSPSGCHLSTALRRIPEEDTAAVGSCADDLIRGAQHDIHNTYSIAHELRSPRMKAWKARVADVKLIASDVFGRPDGLPRRAGGDGLAEASPGAEWLLVSTLEGLSRANWQLK